jgi:peptidyl-prolyl cis-trans isomerase C
MKKPVYLLFAALLFALYGCDQLQTPHQSATAPAAPTPEGPVVATVNGAPIMKSVLDVYGAQRKANQTEGEQVSDEEILNEVISLELMRQEGVSKGLDTTPTIIATMDQQTRTLLAGAAIRDYVKKNPVTDEQARQVYDKEIGKPGTEYNARHILVKTREEADEIIHELDKGGDFSALAK